MKNWRLALRRRSSIVIDGSDTAPAAVSGMRVLIFKRERNVTAAKNTAIVEIGGRVSNGVGIKVAAPMGVKHVEIKELLTQEGSTH